jgi:hypothetical protein
VIGRRVRDVAGRAAILGPFGVRSAGRSLSSANARRAENASLSLTVRVQRLVRAPLGREQKRPYASISAGARCGRSSGGMAEQGATS